MLLGQTMQEESPYDFAPKDSAQDDFLSKPIACNIGSAMEQKKGRDAAYNIDLFSGQDEEVKRSSTGTPC